MFTRLQNLGVAIGLTILFSSGCTSDQTSRVASPPSSNPGSVLSFESAPTQTIAGRLLSPTVRVRIVDRDGRVVTSATNSVSISARSSTGASVPMRGTATVSAVNGVAQFQDLSFESSGDGYTLVATAADLQSATSYPIHVERLPVVIDSNTTHLISDSADIAKGKLTFTVGAEITPAASGTVILGGEGGGFLRRVVTAEKVGSTIRYTTAPASLDEIAQNDSLVVHLEIPRTSGIQSAGVRGAIANDPPRFIPALATVTGAGRDWDVSNLPLFGSPGAGVVIRSGHFRLDLAPDLRVKFSAPKSASLTVTGSMTFDATVDIGLSGAAQRQGSTMLGTVEMHFATVVDGWPVWGSFEIPITLEWSISAQGQAQVGLAWSGSTTATGGAAWNEATGWGLVQSSTFAFTPQTPTVSVNASVGAHLGLQAKPRLVLYNAAGGDIRIQPYAEASVAVDIARNQFTSTCGSALSLGVDLDLTIAGHTFGAYSKTGTFLQNQYAICTRSGTLISPPVVPPPAAPSIQSLTPNPIQGSQAQQIVTISGSGFVSGSIVRLRDLTNGGAFDKTPMFLNGGQLQVSAIFGTNAGTWSVEVRNPDGTSSGQVQLPVIAGGAPQAPKVVAIAPSLIVPANVAQTLIVSGSNFAQGAKVRVRNLSSGAELANSISSTSANEIRLSATIPVSTTAASLEVVNPDSRTSGEIRLSLAVVDNGPSITAITPNPVTGSAALQALTINGTNFANKPVVVLTWTGQSGYTVPPNQVTFLSSSQLQIGIATTTAADSWTVRVVNPNGMSSNVFGFQVIAPVQPAPIVNAVSPNPIIGSTAEQTMTVTGANFLTGATVRAVDGTGVAHLLSGNQAIVNSASQIKLLITTGTAAANWTVQVINPDGAKSNVSSFAVQSPAVAPSISGVSPSPVIGSSTQQTITINGANFTNKPTLMLTWSGQSGYTVPAAQVTYVSNTQLQMAIATTTATDNWSVKATNPNGQTSNTFGFQVIAPPPAPSIGLTSTTQSFSSVQNGAIPAGQSVTITNNGGGTLSGLEALVVYRSGASWLTATLSGTTAPASISVRPSTSALAPGVYTADVYVSSGVATNSPARISVTYTVTGLGPAISGVSPSPVIGANGTQPFTINGANFVAGAMVTLRDVTNNQSFPNRTIASLTPTQIVINPAFTTAAALWSAQVINPDGQTSAAFNFQVNAPPALPPLVTSVSPSPVVGSNSQQTILVNGANFVSKPTVTLTWTGQSNYIVPATQVTFVSSTQVHVAITTTTAPDNWTVKVTNPNGQASNALGFPVIPPVPSPAIGLGSTTQSFAAVQNGAVPSGQTVAITNTGGGTLSGIQAIIVYQSGSNWLTATLSGTTAPATISIRPSTSSLTAGVYRADVYVSSGVATNSPAKVSVTYTVTGAGPAIGSVSPNPFTGSSSAQAFTINGSNFVSGATVTLRDITNNQSFPNRTISSLSATQIVINPVFTTSAAAWSVQVINPDGQASSAFNFQVIAPPPVAPVVYSVSPNPVTGSNSQQTIVINGANFVSKPAVTLTWTGQSNYVVPSSQVTYVSTTQVLMSINTTTVPDNWTVRVTNPNGQSSNAVGFQVIAPVTTGTLKISFSGLPAGVSPAISVFTSSGSAYGSCGTSSNPCIFNNVPAGSYTIKVYSKVVNGVTYTPTQDQVATSVSGGQTTSASVTYR